MDCKQITVVRKEFSSQCFPKNKNNAIAGQLLEKGSKVISRGDPSTSLGGKAATIAKSRSG